MEEVLSEHEYPIEEYPASAYPHEEPEPVTEPEGDPQNPSDEENPNPPLGEASDHPQA